MTDFGLTLYSFVCLEEVAFYPLYQSFVVCNKEYLSSLLNSYFLSGLLQLLFGREHCGVGPAQPDASAAVPGTHRRRVLHRHIRRRHQTLDRRPRQHCAVSSLTFYAQICLCYKVLNSVQSNFIQRTHFKAGKEGLPCLHRNFQINLTPRQALFKTETRLLVSFHQIHNEQQKTHFQKSKIYFHVSSF